MSDSEVSFFDVSGGAGVSPGSVRIDGVAHSFFNFHAGFEILPGKYIVEVDYTADWEDCSMSSFNCPRLYTSGVCNTHLEAKKGARYRLLLRSKIPARERGRMASAYDRQVSIINFVTSKEIDSSDPTTNDCTEINSSTVEPLFR